MSDLIAGVIDGRAERTFLYGACAGLAIAIHKEKDWPLLKVTDAESVYRVGTGEDLLGADLNQRALATNDVGMGAGGLHWGVLHPSGRFLDIRGLSDLADVVEEHDGDADAGEAALGVTTLDDAIDEYVIAKGEPVPLDLVRTFVRPLLDSLN